MNINSLIFVLVMILDEIIILYLEANNRQDKFTVLMFCLIAIVFQRFPWLL